MPEVPKSNSIVAAALSFSAAELTNYSACDIIDQVCDPLSLIVAPHDTFVHPPSLALHFHLDHDQLNKSQACRAFGLIVFAIPIKIELRKKKFNKIFHFLIPSLHQQSNTMKVLITLAIEEVY
jgi:hypothetical protein